MTTQIDPTLQKKFKILLMRLSPENLSQDGELTAYETRLNLRRLQDEWKVLEKAVGRKVSEDEVYAWLST